MPDQKSRSWRVVTSRCGYKKYEGTFTDRKKRLVFFEPYFYGKKVRVKRRYWNKKLKGDLIYYLKYVNFLSKRILFAKKMA